MFCIQTTFMLAYFLHSKWLRKNTSIYMKINFKFKIDWTGVYIFICKRSRQLNVSLCNAIDNFCCFCSWLPQCAEILLEMKSCWSHLVPVKEGESAKIIKLFFECVCSLMSLQIRQLVMKSLLHFLGLITPYKVSWHCFKLLWSA